MHRSTEFAAKQLENIKENDIVTGDVEIKDYHYDNVKQTVNQMIEKDKDFINSDSFAQIKDLKKSIIVFCSLSVFFTVINFIMLVIRYQLWGF